MFTSYRNQSIDLWNKPNDWGLYDGNIAANIYYFKVNNKNPRKRCEICSKLIIKTPERRRSGDFIVNFEHISHLFLAFLLLTLNKQMLAGIGF